mmetsp:Transcript_48390/g.149485  ORF Transcript_48390/g.149485 Transcript_48390/m.149485 type:complete len:424 (+) Transcript_48390:50-1321(+)
MSVRRPWYLLLATSRYTLAHGLWNDCSLADVLDTSSMPDLADFWNIFVRNESGLSVDTGADMSTARFFMRWARTFTKSDDVFDEIIGNCLFGFLTVALHALPVLEYERGRDEALAMLETAQAAWAAVSRMESFDAVIEEAESLGWDVQAILDTLQSYTHFLSSTSNAGSSCNGLKFYVYPPPSSSEGTAMQSQGVAGLLRSGPANYLHALARSPLQCLFGMYGTELLYHKFFSSAGCRVTDPEHADFFFVPSYFKCIEVINYADHFNADRAGEDEAGLLFHQTLAYVKQAGPWFDRHDGSDHIMLFSWGRFPCRLPGWREAARSAIALQVEDRCEDLNSRSRSQRSHAGRTSSSLGISTGGEPWSSEGGTSRAAGVTCSSPSTGATGTTRTPTPMSVSAPGSLRWEAFQESAWGDSLRNTTSC